MAAAVSMKDITKDAIIDSLQYVLTITNEEMKKVQDQNTALQKRNTELVEKVRQLENILGVQKDNTPQKEGI